VRGIGDEAALRLERPLGSVVGRLEALEHLVERRGQPAQLVAWASAGDPPPEALLLADPFGRARDLVDRTERQPGQQPAGAESEPDDQAAADDQQRAERPERAVLLGERPGDLERPDDALAHRDRTAVDEQAAALDLDLLGPRSAGADRGLTGLAERQDDLAEVGRPFDRRAVRSARLDVRLRRAEARDGQDDAVAAQHAAVEEPLRLVGERALDHAEHHPIDHHVQDQAEGDERER
jgi:hypothetical protein